MEISVVRQTNISKKRESYKEKKLKDLTDIQGAKVGKIVGVSYRERLRPIIKAGIRAGIQRGCGVEVEQVTKHTRTEINNTC